MAHEWLLHWAGIGLECNFVDRQGFGNRPGPGNVEEVKH